MFITKDLENTEKDVGIVYESATLFVYNVGIGIFIYSLPAFFLLFIHCV